MLADDPLGRDYLVMRAYINQGVYLADPGRPRLRAEFQTRVEQLAWGDIHAYQWRMVCPLNVVNHGPDVYVIVAQCHDQNAASISRRPTFDIAYNDGKLKATLARTDSTSGIALWEQSISPGQEIEITLRVKWADGTHVQAADGLFDLYADGALVYSLYGQKNTWDSGSPEEQYPPYLKAGVYQSQNAEAAWAGKDFSWYHVGSIVSNDPADSATSLRALIDSQLYAASRRRTAFVTGV